MSGNTWPEQEVVTKWAGKHNLDIEFSKLTELATALTKLRTTDVGETYQQKPIIVKAIKWDGNADKANAFIGERYGHDWEYYGLEGSYGIILHPKDGRKKVSFGDWIIKDPNGNFITSRDDAFREFFEKR